MTPRPGYFLLLVFTLFFGYSCSVNKNIDKNMQRLHNNIPGRWQVNKDAPEPGNNLVRQRGLPAGSIIFYPNNSFMYLARRVRYTGTWEVKPSIEWQEGYIDEHDREYAVYQLSLQFNGATPLPYSYITMEKHFARHRKMKFVTAGTEVNIFRKTGN